MGGISGHRQYFVDSFIEIVGYKTGILLDQHQLFELLDELGDFRTRLMPDGDKGARLHSVEVEEVTAFLLNRVGNTATPSTMSSHIALHHKYKGDKAAFDCFMSVSEMFIEFLNSSTAQARVSPPKSGKLDPSDFIRRALDKHGTTGGQMALEMISGVNGDMHRSPWGKIRSVDWTDTVELRSLFESESLETSYGSFFDQRFIDYLHQNFDEIGQIHWRKFEGLTGEFFEREGFQVDVGPGRNDDGIDLKIYRDGPVEGDPALIIVQCKRQKTKIDKALVKSVYADVLHEKAESGLIVTTSSLSPGAARIRNARSYPVADADRETLREWVRKMRTQ
ncbi:restriction endonuclease [Ruegeria sp.]|uniref:restriction endonuclease n=1 Tax=Ruegeria sp. TaxID=1879320 RepID=UPI00230C49C3|nr:restriction endonuclease [Ruegeria sp.]MDA7966227.1 restriction endonuclease [Ruegeria sp.]